MRESGDFLLNDPPKMAGRSTIGDVIRRLRTGLSMTQAELGTRMGVIKQTISNWEKNISTPNIDATK